MTIREEVEKRIRQDPELNRIRRKIENGNATYADTSAYSIRSGKLLGEILSGHILDIPVEDREQLCVDLLHDRYVDINLVVDEVQSALDAAQGLRIAPRHAPENTERSHQIGTSLRDPTKPDDVIQRRAGAATETATKAVHDDRMKSEAKFRKEAGLKSYLNRVAAAGCCPWCSDIAGRYVYGDHPEDIFRRHDNCDCSVTYESGRQRQDVWSKKTWEAPGVGAGAGELTVLTEEQAAGLQQKRTLHMLTKLGDRDIINHKMASSKQNPPDFTKYPVREDMDAVKRVASTMSSTLGIEPDKVKLDGIKNADVLEPFVKRLQKIQSETGMQFPPICAVEVIDGDATCIAGYKPHENTLYISSRYFNSKDALIDTMKDWADNGILPKQAKSIAYLAEHESAHIRIPDDWLDSDEARDIHRRFNKTKYSNDNDKFSIEEFFADSEAWCRIAPNSAPKQMIEATEYIKQRRET